MITSCYQTDKSKTTTKDNYIESGILEICTLYNIPTEHSIFTIVPPTRCQNCIRKAHEILDSIPKLYILHSPSFSCEKSKKFSTQNCITYDTEILEENDLKRYYPLYVEIENNKVKVFKALL